MAKRHVICPVEDLPPGERRIVEIDGRSIGIFNLDGEFFALRNVCPHQRAPLCEGRVSGTTLPSPPNEFHYGHEGEIIRCPWHGWEFNIKTGRSVFNPHRMRVKTYQVMVESETGEPEPRNVAADEEDPAVETYDVGVEDADVVLYV